MPDYGLLPTGFVPKSEEIIRAEMEEAARTAFGPSIPLGDGTLLGHLIAITAASVAEVWEVAESVNSSQDPDNATGAALDALSALTGCVREAARPSTVDLTLTGTPATAVPSGTQASTDSTSVLFETAADTTIVLLSSWTITTGYVVGDRATNAARCYECITAGTSAGSGGPTTTSADITDGTVHWKYLGEGTGAIDVEARSVLTGPLVAVARDISVIVTPVGGLSTVTNLLDADLGADIETDAAFRVRREDELGAAGTSPIDALRADLLAVPGVTTVKLFVNNTDTKDADGVPPHSVEALVQDGDDQDIWDALLASVAAGIGTHGTETGTSIDSEGTDHTMKFSRPEEVLIYVDVTLIYDADLYPSDGDTQVKTAIVAWGDARGCGQNAVASQMIAAAFGVAGVLDVTDIDIDDAAAPPNGTTVQISTRQLAVYDTTRITVASTPGTP